MSILVTVWMGECVWIFASGCVPVSKKHFFHILRQMLMFWYLCFDVFCFSFLRNSVRMRYFVDCLCQLATSDLQLGLGKSEDGGISPQVTLIDPLAWLIIGVYQHSALQSTYEQTTPQRANRTLSDLSHFQHETLVADYIDLKINLS